jgi:lipopolysaccharide/colanic/teichoic acid biosynthesis glycosyltransferase
MASYFGKRALDLALTVPAFVSSLPLQAVIAVIVRLGLGKPVLFRQERPGLNGQPFEMVKFRTMLPLDPARGWTDDASRMTRLGSILRSTSLDELPTLWNIVKGDMSLVGPRPLLMEYMVLYTPEQNRRHEARPGLTGLAQVSGRNLVTWNRRLEFDVQYIDHQSPLLDAQILWRTAWAVFRREGISATGAATMPRFLGTHGPSTHD